MKLFLGFIFFQVFFLLCLSSASIKSEDLIDLYFQSDKNLVVGEELTYLVSYSFMKLGEVKIKIRDKKVIDNKAYYNAIAHIDSYSGIPFVNIHQIYESNVSSDYYSLLFRGISREAEPYTYTEYYFNYDEELVRVKKGQFSPARVWTDSTGIIDKFYQDGLSIFYYARMNCGQDTSIDVPCLITDKKVFTKINFYNEVTDVSINAVDYNIEVVRLDGEMQFISIFGLTGYFEGWFSNDEASIPLVANMKVIIGNIRLELIRWKREGWEPPQFKG